MDDIVRDTLIEIVKLIFASKIEKKYQHAEIEKKINNIMEELDNIIDKEPDGYIREVFSAYCLEQCCTKVLGKNEINYAEVERQLKNRYGVILRDESKWRLTYALKRLDEQINSLLSPGELVILSSQREIILQIENLKAEFLKNFEIYNCKNEIAIKKIKDDSDKYIELWKKPLFMEAGERRKLSDIFVKTNFIRVSISKEEHDGKTKRTFINKENEYHVQYLNDYLDETNPLRALKYYESDKENYSNLDEILRKFIKSDKKISIILGLPGSGKSSLVSYLAGKYFNSNTNVFFITLSKIRKNNSLLDAICVYLEKEPPFLEGKILVLDGLDEVGYIDDVNSAVVNFINEIKNTYKNVKILITVRENCIDLENQKYGSYFSLCHIIKIVHFGLRQMIDFHYKYTGTKISLERLEWLNKEKEVLGIPLLLYIVYSLGIDISDQNDKYKLYEKIFSIQNGIYDKCNDGRGGYDLVRKKFTVEDKESFHAIAQIIAYKMLQNDSLIIKKVEIENIVLEGEYTDTSKTCYLYNNFYERVEDKIGFIHKSFYEFFLAEYIGNKFKEIYFKSIKDEEKYELLNILFSRRRIEEEVYGHLLNKMYGEIYIYDVNQISSFFSSYIKFIMNYGCGSNKRMGVLNSQACLFYNVLKLIKVISIVNKTEIILHNISLKSICDELVNIEQMGYWEPALLYGISLETVSVFYQSLVVKSLTRKTENIINIKNGILIQTEIINMQIYNSDWMGICLLHSKIINCIFERTILNASDFRWCVIYHTKFINVDFRYSNFRYADIRNVSFRGSDLYGADFEGCTLDGVEFDEDNVGIILACDVDKSTVRVFVREKRKMVSYDEYLNNLESKKEK